jgi:putative DNA primase/helicase
VPIEPNLAAFPRELRELRRWVTWRHHKRGSKATKKPDQSIVKPKSWLSSSEACDRVARGEADGVGFVLGDGIVGIDLDACIDDDGSLHDVARDAISLGTYVERSPSGHGLHVWIRATVSKSQKISASNGVPGREIYNGRKRSARYFTVTGDQVGNATLRKGAEAQAALDPFVANWFPQEQTPAELATNERSDEQPVGDDDVLAAMFNAKDGAKWKAIFHGTLFDYPSPSEADLALCGKLRFYTAANAAQMDRLFRRSALMRPKWDEKHGAKTYGDATIEKAVALRGPVYRHRQPRHPCEAADGQFAMIDRSVLTVLSRQNKREILTYIALRLHSKHGECWPSAARIAVLTGTTREHAQSSISKLVAVGLILKEARPGMTSIFRLPTFEPVPNLDTRGIQPGIARKQPAGTRNGRLLKLARPTQPVSALDTPPVSKLDTQNR